MFYTNFMHEHTLIDLENLFLALSDKTRLRLLALMANGEVSVGFLAEELGESQPKISRHLAYLRTAGLVSTRRDGKWVYYDIDRPDDMAVAGVLDVTLRSITTEAANSPSSDGYEYINISAEPYMTDWSPNEIEIHLL